MHQNIPIEFILILVEEILYKSDIDAAPTLEFMKILKLCLETNVCQFQNQTYRFSDGLPMGGPLSSLMYDIFMNHLEQHMVNNSPYMYDVLFWGRYVHDVFCIYNGHNNSLSALLDTLNSFHPNIKFTLEIGGKTINFLDMKIALKCDKDTPNRFWHF